MPGYGRAMKSMNLIFNDIKKTVWVVVVNFELGSDEFNVKPIGESQLLGHSVRTSQVSSNHTLSDLPYFSRVSYRTNPYPVQYTSGPIID